MADPKQLYYEKRAAVLIKNLQSRHFDAYYCSDKEAALQKALELIPEGASVGWGGAMSAQQIGLMDAVKNGNFAAIDRDSAENAQQRMELEKQAHFADVFLTGANAISVDGEMVNIDGYGNRVSAIICGPKNILVIAGMNKVVDTLEDAISRARTVAAPANQQRFLRQTPCTVTGVCADCKSPDCICNHIVITRHCRPAGRIQFILVGEELGL